MFNFFKKSQETKVIVNTKKGLEPAAKKSEVTSGAVKSEKNLKREKHIVAVMEKTGWDRATTVKAMKAAKNAVGISYGDYNRNDFYKVAVEDQEEKYQAILEKKERKKKHKAEKEEKAIAGIMKITGWEKEEAIAKVIEAQNRTGCTYKEYLIYRFFDLTEKEQDEVFVAKFSRKITAKYDVNKKFEAMLYNKEETNEYFAEYLRRPWCVNTKISFEDFKEKFIDSKRIIYKPLAGNRGKGVEAFDVNEENIKEVYETLLPFPEGVVEQYVVQHPEVSKLSPSSVNTIRVVTVSSNTQQVTPDGKMMDIAYAALRIGGGKSIVDNFHSGGMVAAIDLETGELVTDAADMEGNVFEKHPATGTVIKGFKIPYFAEVLELVKDACVKNKVEGYLGWDIAVTENGPVLIEVNVVPGVVLLSMPYVAERKGMKYVMEKYV